MILNLGPIVVGSTIYIPFHTFAAAGNSVTMTGFALGDILVYKNGSITQRSSTAGFTLLDTDGIDFDGITGLHGFKIDLSDNTDAGFYAAGSSYMVGISSVTADSQTLNFWAAVFTIINDYATASDIASAVVDIDMTAHQAQGSLGQAIGDPVSDTNSIYKAVVTDANGATVGIDSTAIAAKTGSMVFTKANELDVNVQSINDTTVTGNGQTGTTWGP